MSMTFEERAAAVQRLSIACSESPRLYRLRVLAWILLGYVIIVGLLALSLALSAGVVAGIVFTKTWVLLKFVWIPIGAAWFLARSLFVRMDPPEGRVLVREEVPALFDVIDEIRAKLGVRSVHRVLLVGDMNAAVAEAPRFGGLFGWRRYLLVGAPLLITHSLEEIKAILAHEFGHLSGRHGRVAAWSWRVRVTWSIVSASIDRQTGGIARMLQRLVHWYFDHLLCVTLVQARAQEVAADEFAVQLTDAPTAARALAWVSVAESLMSRRLWVPLWESANDEPEPPGGPLNEMMAKRQELLAPPYDDVLETELARATALDDTHPALRDRLQHIGIAQPELGPSPISAAEVLFGASGTALMRELDDTWRTGVAEMWHARHHEVAKSRKLLSEIESADVASVDAERLHTRAESLAELGRNDEALAIYHELASRDAKDARAAFQLGRLLVQRGDLDGLAHLTRAMENDWRAAVPVCEVAYNALREKGLEKEADAWAARYREEQIRLAQVQAEAGVLSPDDDFAPSDLPLEEQERIAAKCFEAKWISKVWIARKSVGAGALTVNFVAVRAMMFHFAGARRVNALVQSLQADVIVFVVESGALMRRLDRVPTARRFRVR